MKVVKEKNCDECGLGYDALIQVGEGLAILCHECVEKAVEVLEIIDEEL